MNIDTYFYQYVLPHELSHSFHEDTNKVKQRFWHKFKWFSKRSETITRISDMEMLRKIRSERNLQLNSHRGSISCDNSNEHCSSCENNTGRKDSFGCDGALVCQICLDPYSIGDKVAIPKHETSCDHIFHEKCIKLWLKRSNTCPCCRETYIHIRKETSVESKRNSFFCQKFGYNQQLKNEEMEQSNFCQIHGIVHASKLSGEEATIIHLHLDESKTSSISSTADLNV